MPSTTPIAPHKVGLQLTSAPVACPGSRNPTTNKTNDASYDPSIMHRAVAPTLCTVSVQVDATLDQLSAHFRLPTKYIQQHWITSETPLTLPRPSPAPQQPSRSNGPVIGRYRSIDAASPQLQANRELASALRRKLAPLLRSSLPSPTSPPPCSKPPLPHNAHLYANLSQNPSCGLALTNTHADLCLTPRRTRVSKRRKGLYRAARTAHPIKTGHYAEVVVELSAGDGGICVGVAPVNARLDRLVGGAFGAAALHGAGKVVVEGVWRDGGIPFATGDVIGVRVDDAVADSPLSGADAGEDEGEGESEGLDAVEMVRVTMSVNGTQAACVDVKKQELFVMVSLYREHSRVRVCCCQEDWRFGDAASNALPLCGCMKTGAAAKKRLGGDESAASELTPTT